MKFGYCTGMSAKDPDGTGYERIPLLKQMGYDFVELPLAQVMSLSEEAFATGPLQLIKETGVPCLRMNSFIPGSYRLTGPNADHYSTLEYAKAAMERAERLGAKVLVFGSSGARNRPLGTSLQQGLDQLASLFTQLAPIAASHGITIAIEHLNKLESNMINRFLEGCALARQLNDPCIGVLWDTYHMSLSDDSCTSVLNSGSLLQHVHVARTLGRSLPCHGDDEDYGQVFEVLQHIGYDGTVSLEAVVRQDFEKEAAEALAVLKAFVE